MERVPVAESGGSAADRAEGSVGAAGAGARRGPLLTIVAGQEQRDVPSTLQEGGRVQQLPLGADGAGLRVQLQPVRGVVEQSVAVGEGLRETSPQTPRGCRGRWEGSGTHVRVWIWCVSGSLAV